MFSRVLRREIGMRFPTVEYLCTRDDVLVDLVKGCVMWAWRGMPARVLADTTTRPSHCKSASSCATASSRSRCARLCCSATCVHGSMRVLVLIGAVQDLFYKFFDYVQLPAFDVAADAFSTLKDLLTKHKIVAANFLETNYDKARTWHVMRPGLMLPRCSHATSSCSAQRTM